MEEGIITFFEIRWRESRREYYAILVSSIINCESIFTQPVLLLLTLPFFLHLPTLHPRSAAETGVRTPGTSFAEIGRRRKWNFGIVYFF